MKVFKNGTETVVAENQEQAARIVADAAESELEYNWTEVHPDTKVTITYEQYEDVPSNVRAFATVRVEAPAREWAKGKAEIIGSTEY